MTQVLLISADVRQHVPAEGGIKHDRSKLMVRIQLHDRKYDARLEHIWQVNGQLLVDLVGKNSVDTN